MNAALQNEMIQDARPPFQSDTEVWIITDMYNVMCGRVESRSIDDRYTVTVPSRGPMKDILPLTTYTVWHDRTFATETEARFALVDQLSTMLSTNTNRLAELCTSESR